MVCEYVEYATIITKFPRRGQIPTNPEKGSNVENPENGFNLRVSLLEVLTGYCKRLISTVLK